MPSLRPRNEQTSVTQWLGGGVSACGSFHTSCLPFFDKNNYVSLLCKPLSKLSCKTNARPAARLPAAPANPPETSGGAVWRRALLAPWSRLRPQLRGPRPAWAGPQPSALGARAVGPAGR